MPKSIPRFFIGSTLVPGQRVRLAANESRHARSRRVKAGDQVVVLDGIGAEAEAVVVSTRRGELDLEIGQIRAAPDEAQPGVTLCLPTLRPSRLTWAVEKATELGVERIVFTVYRRGQADRAEGVVRDLSRFERLAREAMKQCGRTTAPRLELPKAWRVLIDEAADHRFLLDRDGEPFPRELSGRSAILAVGPEGGLAEEERAQAAASGWRIVRVPGFTLRAETAAIAGLALLFRAFDTVQHGAENKL